MNAAVHRVLPTVVRVALIVVLLAGAFLLFGNRTRVVTPEDAVRLYRSGVHELAGPPRPAGGVYLYDTTGHERVDRLSIRREYPAVTARIVRLKLGCEWQEQVVPFHEHVETYDVCTEGDDVRDLGFGTRLTYYRTTMTTGLTCARGGGTRTGGGMEPGETLTYGCQGGGDEAKVTVAYEGEGSATVEDVLVPCRRVVITTVLSGDNTGGARRALCTDPRTGLVLTEERSVGIVVRSRWVGRVTYSEEATFRLRSLVPLTEEQR